MTTEEQCAFLAKEYAEAKRYMDNAEGFLKKAKKVGNFYTDKKYVRTACGTAYNGVLIAIDAWLKIKGVERPKGRRRKSIDYYMDTLAQLDKKMLSYMDNVYRVLHLEGYYDGINSVRVITAGFKDAHDMIKKIKPAHED